MKEYLTTDSNRLVTALNILQQPSVRQFLTEKYGFNYPGSGLHTLEDVLRAHPKTRQIFEQHQRSLSEEQQTAYNILRLLEMVYEPSIDKAEALESFRNASSLARELRYSGDRLEDELVDITQPMNSARNLNELTIGTNLRLYELLQRDYDSASGIWKKLGLEKQFRQRFPNDQSFWSSQMSLLEIHKTLLSDKQSVGGNG